MSLRSAAHGARIFRGEKCLCMHIRKTAWAKCFILHFRRPSSCSWCGYSFSRLHWRPCGFRKFSESRWMSVSETCKAVTGSISLGLFALTSYIRSLPKVSGSILNQLFFVSVVAATFRILHDVNCERNGRIRVHVFSRGFGIWLRRQAAQLRRRKNTNAVSPQPDFPSCHGFLSVVMEAIMRDVWSNALPSGCDKLHSVVSFCSITHLRVSDPIRKRLQILLRSVAPQASDYYMTGLWPHP